MTSCFVSAHTPHYAHASRDKTSAYVTCCTADRCRRSRFRGVYSTSWYRRRCYITFTDYKVTWLQAASRLHTHTTV